MRYLLLYAAWIGFFPLGTAQTPAPGGVGGVAVWYAAAKSAGNAVGWKNQLATPADWLFPAGNPSVQPQYLLNFNPALYFGPGHNGIQLALGQDDYSKSTFFTVYLPEDTLKERAVWSQEDGTMGKLVLTTQRMADLAAIKYMNFVNQEIGRSGINTYNQFKEKSILALPQTLRVGMRPESPVLPAAPFKGIIPELIIYDRFLADRERAKVESYLALKYGLTLSPLGTVAYLNSREETIWDFKKNYPYSNNIAGVGRDDASGLYQKQSESSYTPGFLSVGVDEIAPENAQNKAFIPDNSFLIWGDNLAVLDFAPKEQGQAGRLQRQWLMAMHGNGFELNTILKFHPKEIEKQPHRGEFWWLIIDRSGTGKFPANATVYFIGRKGPDEGAVLFENIQWDTDRSGSDIFTFGIGPAMMAKVWITAPTCTPPVDGRLDIGAEGGTPPYQFVLTSLDSVFFRTWTSKSNEVQTLEGIAAGDYRLRISDANEHAYLEGLYIQSADAPLPALQPYYELAPGKSLHLDASAGMPEQGISYHWSGPDGFESHNALVHISTPGRYLLILEQAGCVSRQLIEVSWYSQDVFKEVSLFPNPAQEGRFNLKMRLHRTADVVIRIFDTSGRLITTQKLTGSDGYWYAGQLETAGAYTITLQSEQITQSLTLVVN